MGQVFDLPLSRDAVQPLHYRRGSEASDWQVEDLPHRFPRHIRVDLFRRVREERKFETPEALKSQILRDVERARTYFRRVARWVRVALP